MHQLCELCLKCIREIYVKLSIFIVFRTTLAKHDQLKISIDYGADPIIQKRYNPFDHRIVEHPNT